MAGNMRQWRASSTKSIWLSYLTINEEKGTIRRKFRDLEFNTIVTEEELLKTFKHLQREQPDEYNYSFENYIRNCTDKDGTLEEIRERVGNAKVIDSLADLPKIGERDKYRGLCVSVELYDDEDDYAIYRVFFLDGKYIEKNVNIAYWSYAIHKDNIK